MQLWLDLKTALRKYGQVDPRIFGQEATKTPASNGDKPSSPGRKKSTEKDDQE
jgi:hypothetical protein